MNRPAMREAVLTYLGTNARDPAFPPARLNMLIQNVLNELYADVPEGYFAATTLLLPDTSDRAKYVLAAQASPIVDFLRADDARLDSSSGKRLREIPFGQRNAYGANGYSVVGDDDTVVIYLTPGTTEGSPLFLSYASWPAPWTREDTECPGISSRFHDLPALEAAKQAYAIGNEQRWPESYETLRLDRRAQWLSHVGNRSRDVTLRRGGDL